MPFTFIPLISSLCVKIHNYTSEFIWADAPGIQDTFMRSVNFNGIACLGCKWVMIYVFFQGLQPNAMLCNFLSLDKNLSSIYLSILFIYVILSILPKEGKKMCIQRMDYQMSVEGLVFACRIYFCTNNSEIASEPTSVPWGFTRFRHYKSSMIFLPRRPIHQKPLVPRVRERQLDTIHAGWRPNGLAFTAFGGVATGFSTRSTFLFPHIHTSQR